MRRLGRASELAAALVILVIGGAIVAALARLPYLRKDPVQYIATCPKHRDASWAHQGPPLADMRRGPYREQALDCAQRGEKW